jgi:hypothetical protein
MQAKGDNMSTNGRHLLLMVTTSMLFVNVVQIARNVNLDLITLPLDTCYVL